MKLFVLIIIICSVSGCKHPSKHFTEHGAYDLPYMAELGTTRGSGTVVYYDSGICEQIGDACVFFRSHANAHNVLLEPAFPERFYSAFSERRADCWAAEHVEPNEVAAAVRLLSDPELHKDLPITGDPLARAEHIKTCAQASSNWPDNT
ncbi:MAG: hypothetical protein ACI9ZT_000618 [Gammaproteobacteria bacterium]|jgi:hypothetical protein